MSKKNSNPTSNKSRVKSSAFLYTSTCCNAPANKPPCERSLQDRKEGECSKSPLGTWNCGSCGRKCKVVRQRRPERNAERNPE